MNRRNYVIAHTSYFGIEPNMYPFQGTRRELLEHLNDNDESCTAMRDKELEVLFMECNGDGKPYYMVWDVEGQCQEFLDEPETVTIP